MKQRKEQQDSVREEWREFMKALYSKDSFNPFAWIFRLARALQRATFNRLGIPETGWKHRILPCIPVFAITLVLLCTIAYPLSIRSLIRERWCCNLEAPNNNSEDPKERYCISSPCPWMILHDFLVLYLPGMIIYHFLSACRSSPGVVVAKNDPGEWTASTARGGFVGWNPRFDRAAEEARVALYGPLQLFQKEASSEELSTDFYPSPFASYCDKCDVIRPPRAHHCSVSNRCVLQYDHFCIWLNNSVGYNN